MLILSPAAKETDWPVMLANVFCVAPLFIVTVSAVPAPFLRTVNVLFPPVVAFVFRTYRAVSVTAAGMIWSVVPSVP